MSGDEDEVEVSRWYTHTRKFPQLVGKTHNGTAIWGGPYTYTQIIVFVAIVWVGTKTYDLWGRSDIITNALMLVGVAYGVAVLVGKLPIGMRSPVSVLLGVWRAFSSPGTGRYAGQPIKLNRPHRVTGATQIIPTGATPTAIHQADCADQVAVEPAVVDPQPAPVVAGPRRPALSGVQLLLASTPSPTKQ